MFWQKNELVCQQVVELITDYLEDTLPRAQRRRLEGHLKGCKHCSEYLEQMSATIRLTGTLRAEDLSPEMSAEFGALYERWRSEEDQPS